MNWAALGQYDERWSMGHDTRQKAIDALRGLPGEVCQYVDVAPVLTDGRVAHSDYVIEAIGEELEGDANLIANFEYGPCEANAGQIADLDQRILSVVNEWVRDHRAAFGIYTITHREYIK